MKSKTLVAASIAAVLVGLSVTAGEDDDDGVRGRSEHSNCRFSSDTLDCHHGSRRGKAIVISQGTVIWNATVVDTRDGSLMRNAAIIIDEGKIKQIAPIESLRIRIRGGARAVNGTGKYVVPGYLDMHAHALADADKPQPLWPLFIANGITGYREMSGGPALIQRADKLNADRAAGLVDAPEVLGVPGDLFRVGAFPTTQTDVAARELVRKQKADGADFIKIVAASPPVVMATLDEARMQGLHVAGHLVASVSAVASSNAGWRAVEHLGASYGIVLDCAADEANIRRDILRLAPLPPGPSSVISPFLTRAREAQLYQRVIDTHDAAKCQSVADVFEKNQTWQALTMIRLRTMLASDEHRFRTDPNLRYVEPTLRALWEQFAVEYGTAVPAAAAATFRSYYDLQRNMAGLLHRNGVPILAGSDLGGIWVIPGFGLHQEFRELAKIGLTPLEILQATTLNGAKFLGREASMGTVDEGKNADLVLLDKNPLRSARNLDNIAGVFLNGKYFSRKALNKMKSDVVDAYAGIAPNADLMTAIDQDHKH
jgi:Amidohydrolase family